MRIDGLTPYQVELCDCIYACETHSELSQFLAVLDKEDFQTAMSLITIMYHEEIEQRYIDRMRIRNEYPDAQRMLKELLKN